MKYLLLIDFKSTKKILFLYYLGIVLATLFVHPLLGWGGILLVVRIERDLCKENAFLGIPEFCREFPSKYLYPDEKNLFFYLILLNAIFIWGVCSFIVGIEGIISLRNKVQIIVVLGIISLIVCGFYHLSWMYYFLIYQNVIVCMKVLRKHYTVFAILFLLFARTEYIPKIVALFIKNKLIGYVVIILFLIVEVLFSILLLRKKYETSEIKL